MNVNITIEKTDVKIYKVKCSINMNELIKFVDNTLYFFDIFSMEWEEYDHSFNILTKKEFREVMKNWRFNYG